MTKKLKVAVLGLGGAGRSIASKLRSMPQYIDKISLCSSRAVLEELWENVSEGSEMVPGNDPVKVESWASDRYSQLEMLLNDERSRPDLVIYTCGKHNLDRWDIDTTRKNIGIAKNIGSRMTGFKGHIIVVPNPVSPVCYTIQRESKTDPRLVTGMQYIDSWRMTKLIRRKLQRQSIHSNNLLALCFGSHGAPIADRATVRMRAGYSLTPAETIGYDKDLDSILETMDTDLAEIVEQQVTNLRDTLEELGISTMRLVYAMHERKGLREGISYDEAVDQGVCVVSQEAYDFDRNIWTAKAGYFDQELRFVELPVTQRDAATKNRIRKAESDTAKRMEGTRQAYDSIMPVPAFPNLYFIAGHCLYHISDEKPRLEGQNLFSCMDFAGDALCIGARQDFREIRKQGAGYESENFYTGASDLAVGSAFKSIAKGKGTFVAANNRLGLFLWDASGPVNPRNLADGNFCRVFYSEQEGCFYAVRRGDAPDGHTPESEFTKAYYDTLEETYVAEDGRPLDEEVQAMFEGTLFRVNSIGNLEPVHRFDYTPLCAVMRGNKIYTLEQAYTDSKKRSGRGLIKRIDSKTHEMESCAPEISSKMSFDICFDPQGYLVAGVRGGFWVYEPDNLEAGPVKKIALEIPGCSIPENLVPRKMACGDQALYASVWGRERTGSGRKAKCKCIVELRENRAVQLGLSLDFNPTDIAYANENFHY
ncbi:hypothetical protein GF351_04810 [Candidatus Woesearchaeota archaeon]|nr:hypothetical protein [Candidatus Woesearchaeota archaeon]